MAMMPRPGEEEFSELHEINVTPLIDVMLVLLIEFMVAAPLATVDLPVNLPEAGAAAQTRPPRPVIVTLRADGSLAIGGKALDDAGLAAGLDAASGGSRTEPVYLRADRSLSYGAVMGVMEKVRKAGYGKISLVALQGG
jgi:biopolymer transport protein ExbD